MISQYQPSFPVVRSEVVIIYPDKKKSDNNQWPFQEPKLEVPTIYKAYIF